MPKALTVANLADRSARKFGDKVFVTREITFGYPILDRSLGIDSSKKEITYNEILKLTNGVAYAMRDRLGIRRGDRIAVLLTNLPEMGLVFTAAARLGAVIVPLNFMLKAREVTRIVSDCGAKVLITEPELFAMNIRDKAHVPGIEHWVMVADEERVPDGFESVDRLGEGISEDVWVEPADLAPDEVAAIFYTSGTTGFPKGAMLTSSNLMSTITTSLRLLRIGKKDFGVCALPLAHIFGFTTGIIGGFYSGASGFLMRFFDPEKAIYNIQEMKATLFFGVPAMYALMLQARPENYDLSTMRYWLCGADAMPVEHIKRFEKLGGRFIEGYGLVETAPIVSVNLPYIRRTGTIGIPIPGVKVRIMDDKGNKLARGRPGEIVVRGPNVMKGYWKDEARTAEAFKYDWFHTGDIGTRDHLGYIHFVDREKDVVKVGGYSVFSREVEEEILANPKVLEVAIVGMPHETKGEIPVAFVELVAGQTATEEELLEWCREHIAGYKAPRMIRIEKHMPMTMTLKVLKRDLRDKLLKELAEAAVEGAPVEEEPGVRAPG